jgi:hypothetical protein
MDKLPKILMRQRRTVLYQSTILVVLRIPANDPALAAAER